MFYVDSVAVSVYVISSHGRCRSFLSDMDMVTMYDDAYKQQPANEELGTQTFFANVRIGNWKAAQQVGPSMQSRGIRTLYVLC